MKLKIISGGQTGVDQAGLRAARACGLETGGWAPQGWITTDGPAPWLADFGLQECEIPGYPARTKRNVFDSDGTLLLGNPETPGSKTALVAVARHGKRSYLASSRHLGQKVVVPVGNSKWAFWVRSPQPWVLAEWIRGNELRVLNLAGNRESKPPGIGAAAERLFSQVFRHLLTGE